MQTQQATKTNTAELPIAQRIETARAMLTKLQEAAVDAEAEAKRWAVAFEREPTEQAFASSAVAKQRATNALAAVETHERETLARLLEEQRQAERSRHSAAVDAERAEVEQMFHDAGGLIAEAVVALDIAIGRLAAHHLTRTAAQQAGVGLSPLSLERLTGRLHAQLAPIRAPQASGLSTLNAVARFVQCGSDTRIVLEFARPAGAVSSLLF